MRDLEKTLLHPGIEAEDSQQRAPKGPARRAAWDIMADQVLAEPQQAPVGMLMAGYGPAKRSGNGIGDGENGKKAETLDDKRGEAAHDGSSQGR